MSDVTDPIHYVRLEVTAAMSIIAPDGHAVGDNMVDITLVFGWRTPDPGERSDQAINKALSHQLSPVIAILSTALTTQGWLAMGQTEEPMAEEGRTVGYGTSTPVVVHLVPGEGAKADA